MKSFEQLVKEYYEPASKEGVSSPLFEMVEKVMKEVETFPRPGTPRISMGRPSSLQDPPQGEPEVPEEKLKTVEILKNFLRQKGYSDENFAVKAKSGISTEFKLLVPLGVDGRREIVDALASELDFLGYEYDFTYGRTGRFANITSPVDKVYFLIKPSGAARTGPQYTGEQYEKDLEASISNVLGDTFEVVTAGFGHGSDIVVKKAGSTDKLSIEAKSNVGTDYGQASARIDPVTGEWEMNPTRQLLGNKDRHGLFLVILQKLKEAGLLPSFKGAEERGFGPSAYPDIYSKKGEHIYGLRRSATTASIASRLKSDWFGARNKESLYLEYRVDNIVQYYRSKGDDLMQIRGYGLYALTEEMAETFDIPMFGEGVTGQIRFRLKPHGGPHGIHSFTVANNIRGRLKRSRLSLDNEEGILAVADYLRRA
jgi:hypothetical protein